MEQIVLAQHLQLRKALHMHSRFINRLFLIVLVCCFSTVQANSLIGAEVVFSEFNGTAPSYPFGTLNFQTSPTSLRVFGPEDSGGVGFVSSFDLSSHSQSRFAVDLFTDPSNVVDRFDLELIDGSGNKGKWSIGVSHLTSGVTSTLVSATTLANPTHGDGFQNLDLSDIDTWQIVGTYSTPAPFDIHFDRLIVSDSVAAPPPYPGFEPDAPWRAEAATRIANNRMADLQVQVTDAFGNPISGANVDVQMMEHEFGFGSAVRAKQLRDLNPIYAPYKEKVAELFNLAVVENNLKWEPWVGDWGPDWTQQGAQSAVNWLTGRGIDVRGHNMVWPGYSEVPLFVKAVLDNAPLNATEQQQLRDLITNRINDSRWCRR